MQPDNCSQTSSNVEQSPKIGLGAANVIQRTDDTAPVAPPPRSFRQAQTPRLARRLNRGRGNARKLDQNDGDDSDSDSDKNRNRDDKTRIFLNAALKTAFGNFMRNRFYQRKSSIGNILAGTPSSSPLEVIAREVEAEVIWRLNIFTPATDFGRRDSDIVRYLTVTIGTLYEFLRYCMPMTHSSEESVINSAAQLVRDMSEVSTTKHFTNTLVDSYMSKIIRGFAQPFWFYLQRDAYESMRYIRYTGLRHYPLRLIGISRQKGRLADEYITWVTGGIDESDAQKQYMEEQSNLKLNKAESYESTEDTRQEFIMHPSKPRVVSLILLKGTNPMIVRDVPTAELSSLGWFPDYTGRSYWRHKLHMTEGEVMIFKVSMDEEVLEAWNPINEDPRVNTKLK
ncbi:hypothetical protein FAVG1_03127 [Fusarium avenaceum]|nr:hypothetical protein FAVG1_03127 [Fusarium avenaceum]